MSGTRLSNEELDMYAENARKFIDDNVNKSEDYKLRMATLSVAQSNLVIVELLARLIIETKHATEMNKYHQ